MQFHFEVALALKLYFNEFFRKFNMMGASYPHPGIRSLLHGQTIFMFLVVIFGPVYCIFQLHLEFAQENVF